MLLKKRILFATSIIISIVNFFSIVEANHRWNLLEGYVIDKRKESNEKGGLK